MHDEPIDDATLALQDRMFHCVEVIEKLSPEDQWPHFVGRFFTGLALMNHYLYTAHILTHSDNLHKECTDTDTDADYLVDSLKISDLAIRLFDILTADKQDSLMNRRRQVLSMPP